jgi:purine-binding chemotaxis protein CheW
MNDGFARAPAQSSREDHLLFRLDGALYALPASTVREIIAPPPITRLPNAPDHVRGVMNLRGRIVPVIDLRRRLGLAAATLNRETCVVVLDTGSASASASASASIGAIVDSVCEVAAIDRATVEPLPPGLGFGVDGPICGIARVADRSDAVVLLLDLAIAAAPLASTPPRRVAA